MKPLLLIVPLMALLSSCSSYQYLTLSADKTSTNENKELSWENDSVKISFNFNGAWGKVGVTTYNKTDQPLTINWQKSVIIYNGRSVSLYDPSVVVSGTIDSLQAFSKLQYPGQAIATVNASFALSPGTDFMAPHTYVMRQSIDVSKIVPALSVLPASIPVQKISKSEYDIKFRKAVYDSTSSPFKFRLFLTFSTASNNTEFYTAHSFYVSEIVQTGAGPYTELVNKDGDKFYYQVAER